MIKAVISDIDGVLVDSFNANLKYSKSNLKSADATVKSFKELPKAINKLSNH